MLDESLYRRRVEYVQRYLRDEDVDFALLTPSPNFQYLTGIETEMRERLVALIIQQEGEPKIISPSFEVNNHSNLSWIKDFAGWEEDEDPYKMVFDCLHSKSQEYHATFDNSLPMGIFWTLERVSGGFTKTTSLSPLINKMRIKKTDAELELMKKAGHIIEDAVTKAFNSAHLGITEIELKQIIDNEIIHAGATPTFAAVQFGENSAIPHYGAGNRKLVKQDIVLMDCGCAFGGYNTDMTRVGVVGEPTEDQEKVYSIVLAAEEAAIKKLEPGIQCGSADGIARRIIEDAGYGQYFTHRLGHGIGLEVHEPPYLVRGNSNPLEVGMTHSVEPGIYLEGLFGIRIEDLVCIKEDVVEVITYMPKDLILIEG